MNPLLIVCAASLLIPTVGFAYEKAFEATQPGSYELACAELCGLGHYRMRAAVTVHTAEEYQQWMSEQAQPVALK